MKTKKFRQKLSLHRLHLLSHLKDHNSPTLTPRSPPPLQQFSEPIMEETVELAEEIINRWSYHHSNDHCSTDSLFLNSDHKQSEDFMAAVKDLQETMAFLISAIPNSYLLVRCQKLVQIAMKRLEREFHLMLKAYRQYLKHEAVSVSRHSASSASSSVSSHRSSVSSSSPHSIDQKIPRPSMTDSEDDDRSLKDTSTSNINRYEENNSIRAMDDLKIIADAMITAGYTKECMKIYKAVRKITVHEALKQLGLDPAHPPHFNKMEWRKLDIRMKKWKNNVRVAVQMIFKGEKILCEHVFSSSPDTIREACFSEITKDYAVTLFSELEQMAKTKKASEKIFRFLDLYEAIVEVMPDIESIFNQKLTSTVRLQVDVSLTKFEEMIRAMLVEFETSIHKDNSKLLAPGGGSHHLTQYVMHYLCFLSEYASVLSDIIANDSPSSPCPAVPLPDNYFDSLENGGERSRVQEKFAWLVLVLLCKLDGKAELYRDVGLCYLFLCNNLRYVLTKVQHSSLQFILGSTWIKKHEEVVKNYAENYQKSGWSKVIDVLPKNPAAEIKSIDKARGIVKKFDFEFEDVYRKQLDWVVVDDQLRDEIKISLVKKLVPRYKPIYEIYKKLEKEYAAENGEAVRPVKFTPEELENYLDVMFLGAEQKSGGSVSNSGPSSCCTSSYGNSTTTLASSPLKSTEGSSPTMSLSVWRKPPRSPTSAQSFDSGSCDSSPQQSQETTPSSSPVNSIEGNEVVLAPTLSFSTWSSV